MIGTTSSAWQEANQRYLITSIGEVRAALQTHVARHSGGLGPDLVRDELAAIRREMPAPPTVEMLCSLFTLSPFERDVVLLCAALELDSSFAGLCGSAQGDPAMSYPTFSLALAALPEAHWSALNPEAPLRRWRLIEVEPGRVLTLSPLRIDERVLHYLTGIQYLDEHLGGMVEPLREPGELTPAHRTLAEQLIHVWSGGTLQAVQLCGDDADAKRAVVAAACAAVGVNVVVMQAESLPAQPSEIESLCRLWEREAALSASALVLGCDDLDYTDSSRRTAIARVIERVHGPLVVITRQRLTLPGRSLTTFDLQPSSREEQRAAWKQVLGEVGQGLNGQVDRIVAQFQLTPSSIRAVHAAAQFSPMSADHGDLGEILWDACRTETRPRLDDLAQRIEPFAGWDDLVIPDAERQQLQEVGVHVRRRTTVYEDWGFAGRGTRGLGISALFVGASGTGKTMAAEILARELRLDLYRIDLSAVVSKYIGETEKNLRRVFDAAEAGGAVLLFDEADALFGKRSEVKDSHDRYANIEISYLLQRMEAYRGLAILTTNMKNALDPAFLRRIRFVVQFPFPDPSMRAEIWRRIFPPATPAEGLDVARLARLNLAGGNIRNIALNAAFLAADCDEPVRMVHLLRAVRSEYAKLERPLTDNEIGGWA